MSEPDFSSVAPKDMPPSPKFVLYVLYKNTGYVKQQDIVEETQLSERTVRHALTKLENRGLVETRPNPIDARVREHAVAVQALAE